MTYEFWPTWIAEEAKRTWFSQMGTNKILRIDGMLASSFISKQDKLGNPVKVKRHNGVRKYKLADLIARARALSLKVEPPDILGEKIVLEELIKTKAKLEEEIKLLESNRDGAFHEAHFQDTSLALTGKHMLTQKEIVKASQPFDDNNNCGVYFLVKKRSVIYVGQSINVHTRVQAHKRCKDFDSYCFIPCKKDDLNVLESLYIHALSPKDQGRSADGSLHAPIAFWNLVSMVKPRTQKPSTFGPPVQSNFYRSVGFHVQSTYPDNV